ncbi:hypothetical protein BBJ28_00008808 [Nothophytophthora sp. Chile5]|nr:hypothetical protein BBJ28_00008808 [Nothophytophthora sp. Chile5]
MYHTYGTLVATNLKMAGKRKTHWAVRRKTKQARREQGDGQEQEQHDHRVDRRAGVSEAVHPGSYAAQRQPTAAGADAAAALPTKRRYGIWLAFCGKDYSGMQM